MNSPSDGNSILASGVKNPTLIPNPDLIKLANALGKAQTTGDSPEEKAVKDIQLDNLSLDIVGALDFEDIKTLTDEAVTRLKSHHEKVKSGLVNGLGFDFLMCIMEVIAPLIGIMSTASIINQKGVNRKAKLWSRPELLDVSTLMEYVRRFPTSEDVVRKEIAEQGFTEDDIDAMFELKNKVLSMGDIISYASKDAFNDELAIKYGLDEGAQSLLTMLGPQIEAAGGTKDHFKLAWRAHWAMPHGDTLIQLYHRKIISEVDLRQLLAKQNYSSKVIDLLMQIVHTPLNRRDLKSLYVSGIIHSTNELASEYMKLGYTQQNADKLAAQAEMSKDQAKDIPDHIKEIGKSDVIGAYMDGAITKGDAIIYLVQLGYEADHVEFLIAHADYVSQHENTKILVMAYKRAYLNGNLNQHDLMIKLNMLNLPSTYIDTLITAWAIERAQKPERPSKAEILSFLSNGLIDEVTARQELEYIGYATKYIDMYIAALRITQQRKVVEDAKPKSEKSSVNAKDSD